MTKLDWSCVILNASSSIGKTGINIEFPKVITSGIEAKANKSTFFRFI